MSLKYIRLFFASSIVEFEHERREFGNYIRALNDIYIKQKLYLTLALSEDLSSAMARGRKQAEYN